LAGYFAYFKPIGGVMPGIAIYGAGAVGCVIGGGMARAGHDVVLIDPWRDHVDSMKTQGLQLTLEGEGTSTVPVEALHPAELATDRFFDIVFIAVKSQDTVSAVELMLLHLADGGYLVSAQNGINEDIIVPLIGAERTVGCVITFAAALPEAGHAFRTTPPGIPALILGEVTGPPTPRLERLKELLDEVGPTRLTDNLPGERWAKLINNAMMNPIAGITGLSSRAIRLDTAARTVAIKIGAEGIYVAHALGVPVEPVLGGIVPEALVAEAEGRPTTVVERLITEAQRRGEGSPSLLQDVGKGRKTEVEHLNGLIVRRGQEASIPTPINKAIIGLVKEVEAGRLNPSPANLRLL
jgi:2-dehydropantoate 2-reductase